MYKSSLDLSAKPDNQSNLATNQSSQNPTLNRTDENGIRTGSRATLAAWVLTLIASALGIFQVHTAAKIPVLASELSLIHQQSAEIAYNSNLLSAELAQDLAILHKTISSERDNTYIQREPDEQLIDQDFIDTYRDTGEYLPKQFLPSELAIILNYSLIIDDLTTE